MAGCCMRQACSLQPSGAPPASPAFLLCSAGGRSRRSAGPCRGRLQAPVDAKRRARCDGATGARPRPRPGPRCGPRPAARRAQARARTGGRAGTGCARRAAAAAAAAAGTLADAVRFPGSSARCAPPARAVPRPLDPARPWALAQEARHGGSRRRAPRLGGFLAVGPGGGGGLAGTLQPFIRSAGAAQGSPGPAAGLVRAVQPPFRGTA